ncbi:hypothetical protein RB653_005781 [Dictyostelium firmibasis]|uniref:PCI domain-containing protein n=1 Tax=Dictyostelium firmibasis TaxID=79012 RepID=A0AAN7UC34_9MYCE
MTIGLEPAVSSKTKDKMEQDLSPIADKSCKENRELAKSGKLVEAIENLLVTEKQCRQAEDSPSTSKIAVEIIKLCYEAGRLDLLNEKLVLISKRRGQLRPAIKAIVQESMIYVDQITDMKQKLELIDTLRTISDGKIFVENERARLTKTLSKIKEDEGDIASAAKILQDLQVETYGTMDKREKITFFIDQMRICMNNKDYIRAQLIGNKVNRKTLGEVENQDLKIDYFKQMIRYFSHSANYIEIARCYLSIYDTPSVEKDTAQLHQTLKYICIYVILSATSNEQSDLLNRVYEFKPLTDIQNYKDLLNQFKTLELIRWSTFHELNKPELDSQSVFKTEPNAWDDLRKRVIEHNIRVISTYYQKISTARLAELLDLSLDESEKFVSDLVSSKTIFAKIDRPAGIATFTSSNDPNKVLNAWANNITSLLDLVEKTNHLVQREFMLHKIN